jgi:alkylation response protein AidB-like acyl-CoA dehydrogenase
MVSASLQSAAAARVVPVLASRAEALSRARALTPRIRTRAARTEADRRVPTETIQEMLESGLFGVVLPKVFGGSELGFASLVEVTAEIATACGSTAWVFGVLAGHSWMLNLFPPEAQRELFEDPTSLVATVFRLSGKATAVAGGYRLVGGEGRFCSGIDYASWVIVGGTVVADDAAPESRFFLVPRTDIAIIDDWYTAGMRGTGSRSIRIADAFIPAHRSVSLREMLDGTAPGACFHDRALYRIPFSSIAPFSIVGAPLGMARGAIQAFAESLAQQLRKTADATFAAPPATLARLAEAAAQVDSAFALVLADAEAVDALTRAESVSSLDIARFARNWAYGAQTARYAVTRIFEFAGGSGIYETSDLQRIWRDVNSAAQHYAFVWDGAMTNFGRALVGLPPQAFGIRSK